MIGEDGKQFVKGVRLLLCPVAADPVHRLTRRPLATQLLNRNPKHRLGAQRDAAELKEHPFFKSIDWDLLAKRQIPPPFKPYVDSDESVANFDPEFTEANLFDEAPHDVEWDDDDPSADWIERARMLGGRQHDHSGPREGGCRWCGRRLGRRGFARAARDQAAAEDEQACRAAVVQLDAGELPCVALRSLVPFLSTVADCAMLALFLPTGGFTFSGETESMIHHAAGSFSRLRVDDDDDPAAPQPMDDDDRRRAGKNGGGEDDEWEDER